MIAFSILQCLSRFLAIVGLVAVGAGDLPTFAPLPCNMNIELCANSAIEVTLSSLVGQDPFVELVVPCGTCAIVDYTDGAVVTFPGGIDIVGMLRVPSTVNATIRTTHVIIQGVLKVDPPDIGLRFGFVLYEEDGVHESFKVIPHGENSEHCAAEGCDVGRMPFAVVGGRLEVNGLRDSTCPSHVKLLDLDDTRRILTVGTHAATCWWTGSSSTGDEIYLTSPDKNMEYDHTASILNADINGGTLTVSEPLPEMFAYATVGAAPDFASRVASMRRSIFLDAEEEEANGEVEGETDKMLIGGHLIVYLTPGVAQTFEGVEITNFGQQGNLGKYPIHFHLCRDVDGSKVSKNVIRNSNQRCLVIHGTHNVTIYDNVAVNTFGHCYILEDGFEFDNVFERNLGAHLETPTRVLVNVDHTIENDRGPSVFWIMSPMNHWIDNIAAGSVHSGFWFDTRNGVRGPSRNIPGSEGFIPKYAPIRTFRDNVSHSNRLFGIQYYSPSWQPEGDEQVIEGSIVYRNGWAGHFVHGNRNFVIKGGVAADNQVSVLNFQNSGFRVDGLTIIGYSQNYLDVLDYSNTYWACKRDPMRIDTGYTGVQIHPSDYPGKNGAQVQYSNLIFDGFDSGCPGAVPVRMNAQHLWYKVDWSPRHFINTTFRGEEQPPIRVSACDAVSYGVNSVLVHDVDGTLGPTNRPGAPGFLVSDDKKITTFVNGDGCLSMEDSGFGCLRYCPNACLRMIKIQVSNAYASENMVMIISDGIQQEESNVSRTDRPGTTSPDYFSWVNGYYGAPLPAGNFNISFKDRISSRLVWPSYTEVEFQEPPDCLGYASENMINLIKPDFDADRCGELIVDGSIDELPDPSGGMGSWQSQFMPLELVSPGFGGSGVAIKASALEAWGGKCTGSHCTLQQWIDSSCFVPWTVYKFTANVRLVDYEGNDILCDETDMTKCAVAWLELQSNAGTQKHVIGTIPYPGNIQDGWYQLSGNFLMDDTTDLPDKVGIKWEYSKDNIEYIIDNVSLMATKIRNTRRPSVQPTLTPIPTVTPPPTFVGSNLAYRKPTYQTSTVLSLSSDLAVDGDTSGLTYTHTGGGLNYWTVDLINLAAITSVKIYQRIDCGVVCYHRLNKLWIDILDSRGFTVERKIWDVDDAPSIFEVNFGLVEGQQVKITQIDAELLSFAEVEVYGKYLTQPPSHLPTLSISPANAPALPTQSPTQSPSETPSVVKVKQCPNKKFSQLALTIETGPKGKKAKFNVRRANKKQTKFEKVVLKRKTLPRNDIVVITKCLKKNKCYQATFLYKALANKGIKEFTVTFGGKLLKTSYFKNMTKQVVTFGNCRK